MSENIEQYRERYTLRPETFEAYVDVWHRAPQARLQFSGWAAFSQAANAEPNWRARRPAKVAIATAIMELAGYEIGPSTKRGARRWYPKGSAPGPAEHRPPAAPMTGHPVGDAEDTAPTPGPLVRYPDAPYTDALLSSPLWHEKVGGSRARLDEDRVRAVFAALNAGGGAATFDAVAAATGLPVARVSGLLVALAKMLNQLGDAVLVADPELREARVDVDLLKLTIMGPR